MTSTASTSTTSIVCTTPPTATSSPTSPPACVLPEALCPTTSCTHAPIDDELDAYDPYFEIVAQHADAIDFLMPQYDNGGNSPFEPAGLAAIETNYRALVDGPFGGDAAAFAGVYVLLTLALFGTRPFVDFFAYHLPRLASGETIAFLSQPSASMSNLGVFGVPFKLRIAGWGGSEADASALARQLSWGYTLLVVALAIRAGWRHATPADPHARAAQVGVWFGLLALGALRSPFAPPEALIPLVWALSLRAAAAERRRAAALAATLWISLLIVVPVPSPAGAIVSLAAQAIAYGTAIWLALGPRRR